MANPQRGRPPLSGSVLQILGVLLWNERKASLGFGGATNSEFAKFLLHLPTEGALQPAR